MVTTGRKPESRLLSIPQAARYLNKSTETVKAAVKAGQIPYRQFSGRKLIPVDALSRWRQSGDEPEAT
jgi:excisionase family DNA binding protein